MRPILLGRFAPLYAHFAPEDGSGGGAGSGAGTAGAAVAAATNTAGDAAGAAGAGAATAATGAAASGAAAGSASEGAAAVAAASYRPEGLPDHLFGKTDRETLDLLSHAYKNAREAIAKAGEVPKEVAGYAFQPSDKLKPFTEGLDQDPFFGSMRELALKHKMPAPLFQAYFSDLMEQMVDKGIVAEAFSPDRERKALAPDITDPKARAEAADRIVQENTALVKAWVEQGDMPQTVADSLLARMNFADTNHLLDWIRDQRGEQRPALVGGSAAKAGSEAALDARIADPRNTVGDPKYEPAFARETQRMMVEFYGE